MKIDFKSKKVLIPIVIVLIILLVASVMGYGAYRQQKQQKKIDTMITQIEKIETDFNMKDAREDKIALYQSVSKEYADYEKSKDRIEEVDKKYHSVLSNMQKVLKEGYDKILVDTTLKDIDKISDKEQLSTAITKLSELLQTIQNEEGIICTENEVKEYETKITDLVRSYEDRAAAIEKEEESQGETGQQTTTQSNQTQSSSGNSSSAGNADNTKPNGDDSNSGASASGNTEAAKGPRPAKYSVIKANDFPNDFPRDGWSWRHSTYVWEPTSVTWGGANGDELVDVVWEVTLRSSTNNVAISLAPQTINNVKKYMPPAPTLEQSKSMIKPDSDLFYVRYGAVEVYVCMEE